MGARGLESRLPAEVRAWLEAELIRRGFGDYSEITDELNLRLCKSEAGTASRSAVHRFGSRIEQRLAALKRSTEMAQALAAEVGDDAGTLNDALIRVAQDKLFDVLLGAELDPESNSLSRLTGAISDLARASVAQKKLQRQVQADAVAELRRIEDEARRGEGPTREDILRRLRGIYGLPVDE